MGVSLPRSCSDSPFPGKCDYPWRQHSLARRLPGDDARTSCGSDLTRNILPSAEEMLLARRWCVRLGLQRGWTGAGQRLRVSVLVPGEGMCTWERGRSSPQRGREWVQSWACTKPASLSARGTCFTHQRDASGFKHQAGLFRASVKKEKVVFIKIYNIQLANCSLWLDSKYCSRSSTCLMALGFCPVAIRVLSWVGLLSCGVCVS